MLGARSASCFALLAALSLSGVAFAESRALSDPLARELKAKGDQAMDAGKYDVALAEYEKAAAIEPSPSLLYNRARALQGLKRNAEALTYFEAFESQAPPELLALVPNLDKLMATAASQVTLVAVTGRDGTRVSVNGKEVGTLPLEKPLRLDSAPAEFRFSLAGFEPETRSLDLNPGGSLTLEVAMTEKATTGILRVESSLKQAQVTIDGKSVGFAPSESRVREGAHEVILSHPDYYDAKVTAVVVVEQTKTLKLELEKRPAFYQTYWFWTATGLVVVGTTAAIIALTTERSPDSGDIPPGTVRTFGFPF